MKYNEKDYISSFLFSLCSKNNKGHPLSKLIVTKISSPTFFTSPLSLFLTCQLLSGLICFYFKLK